MWWGCIQENQEIMRISETYHQSMLQKNGSAGIEWQEALSGPGSLDDGNLGSNYHTIGLPQCIVCLWR